MKLNWIPLKSIGPFNLGDDIDNYVEFYNLKYMGKDAIGRGIYNLSEIDIDIYVEDGLIETVCCEDSCIFNGVELIGLPIEDLIKVLDSKPEEDIDTIDMPDGSVQDVYEFDDLGAQVWVDKDTETIVSIICHISYEED